MELDFHMAIGEAEANYANNSRLQRKALIKTKPVLEKVMRQVYMALLPPTMVVADLGCSVGINTLLFVSKVTSTVADAQCHNELGCHIMELQFFLNDLPRNDFNQVFQSLQQFTKSIAAGHPKGVALPPFYISGLPGSYYNRLFPCQSVHLFHSSYCLHWQSQELVPGGKMLLTFLGRKKDDVLDGDLSHLFGLLAQALQSLFTEGIVEKGKLESFNLPIYGPSIDEVKTVITRNKLFCIDHIELFESNWDPYDDLEHDGMHISPHRGMNVAKCIRAVSEPLLASHFGEYILDKLFQRFAQIVERHLAKENVKYSVIVLSLNRRD
uniref:Benzothiadiazole-induced S-adenosyl-L-methionine:salicylic acid carboxyl methyltransferase 1 n=1 Tax=Oryza sativa subsp. japonica TaxID=39947 RepID=Q654H2_ORYSJ|nr:putative benzothiadiazole-induced S-adenosyl-L-methionine:salicylic acid carboxyl methyltransferase 1 [Oryza sativa Japonica Group]